MKKVNQARFYQSIKNILEDARNKAYKAVNFAMVEAYWHIGRLIVEEEQRGEKRAEYGKYLIKDLSQELRKDFGKGFDERNLRYMRQFFLMFPIRNTVCAESSDRIEKRNSVRSEFALAVQMKMSCPGHITVCCYGWRMKPPVYGI